MARATTDWVNKKIYGLAIKVKMARRNKVPAWNVIDNGITPIRAGRPGTLRDQAPNGQGLADRIVNSLLGSKMVFPASPYVWNDICEFPVNRAIIVEGDGPGWRSSAGKGSVLLRLENPSAHGGIDGAMLGFRGSGSGDAERAIGGVKHMQLDGGFSAGVTDGMGIFVQRGQEFTLEDVRLYNFPRGALRANQVFNCDWRKVRVTHSGDEDTDEAAVHIGGAGTPGNVDGTITLDIHGLQLEQNRWVDLRISGNPVGVGHPSTEINIIGGKCEGGLDVEAPYHHLEFAELVNIVGHGIFSHRSHPAIVSEHSVQGPGETRGVRYVGCWFEIGASVTPPDYFIEHSGGSIHFIGCTFKMDVNTALAHVASTARDSSISFTGCQFYDLGGDPSAAPILDDDRAGVTNAALIDYP